MRLPTGQWFYPDTPICSINNIDRHDVADILLKSDLKSTITTDISFFTCKQWFLRLYIHSVCMGLLFKKIEQHEPH